MNKVLPKFSEETDRTKNDTFYSSGILVTEDEENFAQKENICRENMEELSEKFKALMDQCSKESNKNTKNILRKKLAETAEKMKKYRRQYSCKKI